MGRIRSLVVIALFLCGTFVLVGAGIDRDDGGRRMLGVTVDSFSTFEIGELTGVFPTHTETLPLYLHTDSLVTYIECHIYWNDDDLDLDSVTAGPGIPDTVTLTTSNPNDSIVIIEIAIEQTGDPPFGIPDGEPIAYLHFGIQCFGYGQETPVRFTDDNNENVYVSNGILRSPLRDDGSITTGSEPYCCLGGEFTEEYAGDQDMPVGYDLDQGIPGKLLCAHFLYSVYYVQFDSVTAGEDLPPGDSVYAVVENDTVKVILPETNQFLPPEDSLRIFYLHFSAKTPNDSYIAYIVTTYAERLDECGGIVHPYTGYNYIHVPNHTAEADIGEVSYYTSAVQYDVPFDLGSNYPINDYEFWIEFPKDTIAFDEIVAYDSFLPPLGVLSGDSTKILISADIGTDYPPTANPVTVFKIRFQRLIPLPAGTYLYITFYGTAQNGVYFDMDDPYGYHVADLTTEDGYIRIKSKPSGCPALYVWNGAGFERENTILAECDGKAVDNDVTDHYLIERPVQASGDELLFQIREDGEEISRFSDFQLIAVDHPENEEIQVARGGKIVTVGQPHSIIWAKDHKGNDITELIATKDAVPYISTEGGWFDVSFGALSAEEIEGFSALSDVKPKDPPPAENENNNVATRSPLGAAQPANTKLNVSVKLEDGSWKLLAREDARLEPGSQATLIDPSLVSPDHELVLRYSWDGYYEIDVLDFVTVEPFEGTPKELSLVSASHSVAGAVRDRLGIANADNPVTLAKGEAIDLAFKVSSIPPYTKGTKRDYIFVATGRYRREGIETPRGDFALDANFPNPFNPNTTIRYNLPQPAYVELRIYDVRGALVRTLVAEHQAAGEKQVVWDGRLDSGLQAASGVYFYQLRTDKFNRTRKMILLR